MPRHFLFISTCQKIALGLVLLLSSGWVANTCAQSYSDILWMVAGHSGEINAVAYSPDGTLLASVSDDLTVKLWRISDGTLLRTLRGHREDVQSVAFSPDGTTLITGGRDNRLMVWRVATGELLRTLPEIGYPANDAVWSPRFSMALSPDGALVVCARNYLCATNRELHVTVVQLRQLSDGVLLQTLVHRATNAPGWRPYGAVAFSPDGRLIAAEVGSQVFLSQTTNGELARVLSGHLNEVQSLAFSPDGAVLASSSSDSTIKLWQVSDGALLRTISGHGNEVRCIDWSPDGRFIGSASFDQTLRLWQVADGRMVWQASEPSDYRFRTVAFSPDGQYLASGNRDFRVALYRATNGVKELTLTAHTSSIYFVAFSPDEAVLASSSLGGYDNTIAYWRVADGSLLWRSSPTNTTGPVVFSPDSKLVAGVTPRNTVQVRQAADGAQVSTFGSSLPPGVLAFSPDGLSLAHGGVDWWITLWRISDGVQLGAYTNYSGEITGLAYSPDGSLLAAESADGTVKLWRLAEGRVVQSFSGQLLGFSRDGGQLAARTENAQGMKVSFYRVADGQLTGSLWLQGTSYSSTPRPVLLPDWSALVTRKGDVVQSWRVADGALWRILSEETQGVHCMAVSSGGNYVAWGRHDTAVVLARNVLSPRAPEAEPPVIDLPPQDVVLDAGLLGALWVQAHGQMPLTYQWLHSQTHLPGATNSVYSMASVELANAGTYQVVVNNRLGSVTSAVATLQVSLPPRILVQPRSQSPPLGATLELSVQAAGTGPLSYQWRYNNQDLSGQTNASLWLDNVQSAHSGQYSVLVRQPTGSCVSQPAVVVVNTPMQILWAAPKMPMSDADLIDIPDVAFSSDGRRVVAAADYSVYNLASNTVVSTPMVYGWDSLEGTRVFALSGLESTLYMRVCALAPPLNMVAFSSPDSYAIDLYSLPLAAGPMGGEALTFVKSLDGAQITAFSGDGTRLVSAFNNLVKVWQMPEGILVSSFYLASQRPLMPGSLACSSDGAILAAIDQGKINLWQTATGTLLRSFAAGTYGQNRLAFSPDDSLLALGGENRLVTLWRTADGTLWRTLVGPFTRVNCLAFSPGGNLMVAGYALGAQFWRLSDGQALPTGNPGLFNIQAVAFSPNSKSVAAYCSGRVMVVQNPFAAMDVVLPIYRFQPISFLSGGRIQLTLEGPRNSAAVIQSSTNLTDWSDWSPQVFFSGAPLRFVETITNNSPRRFYRAVGAP